MMRKPPDRRYTHKPQSPSFPFLNLPTEIRFTIYEFLLVRPRLDIVGSSNSKRHSYQQCSHRSCLFLCLHATLQSQILLVCRQVTHEATPILYGSNNFYFHAFFSAITFLNTQIPNSAHLIRHIAFDMTSEVGLENGHGRISLERMILEDRLIMERLSDFTVNNVGISAANTSPRPRGRTIAARPSSLSQLKSLEATLETQMCLGMTQGQIQWTPSSHFKAYCLQRDALKKLDKEISNTDSEIAKICKARNMVWEFSERDEEYFGDGKRYVTIALRTAV